MNNNTGSSRRNFIKKLALSSAAAAVGTNLYAAENKNIYFEKLKRLPPGPNDKINIALIGAGGMGVQDVLTALKVPNTKIVAVCDLYDGRIKDAKTKWGAELFTTRH